MLEHFRQISKVNKRLATNMEQMVITMISQGGSCYCTHCQFASWVRLSPKLNIILKLIVINGLDLFMKT